MDTRQVCKDITEKFERYLPFKIPNFNNRFSIYADVDKYKWKEDESVWLQKRDRAAHSFEVLFDGEFVCFFDSLDRESDVILRMLEGIKDLFKNGKVFINEQMYAVKKAQEEAKRNQAIVLPTPQNEAEELVGLAIARSLKKKGKKIKG